MHVATTPHLVARQLKRAPRVRPSRAFNPGPPHIRRSRCLGGDGCTLFRKRPHHLSTLRALDVSPRVQARGGNKDDGIDHPLWMYHRDAGGQVYFEVDTLGNVRRLVTPDGDSVGGYDYTAFGRTLVPADDVLPSEYAQQLRWQGRPYFENGDEGIYDFRARWWSPELGAFTTADEFVYLTDTGTLWSWPGQNPIRYRDPSGRFACGGFCLAAGGAALSGGLSAAFQYFDKGSVDGSDVAVASAFGAMTAPMGGAILVSEGSVLLRWLTLAVVGAEVGYVETATTEAVNSLQGQNPNGFTAEEMMEGARDGAIGEILPEGFEAAKACF